MYLYHKNNSDGTLAAVITITSDASSASPKFLFSADMFHLYRRIKRQFVTKFDDLIYSNF